MLAALGRLEAWLDSLVAGFEAAAADVETARVAQQAAVELQQKLLREGPLTPGETLPAQYQALTEAVVAGRANPRERGFFLRYDHVLGLSRVLQAMYPKIVVTPAAPTFTIGDQALVNLSAWRRKRTTWPRPIRSRTRVRGCWQLSGAWRPGWTLLSPASRQLRPMSIPHG
jgi:hypothetical protein